MKIGDLVKYIADTEDFDADFFGVDMFGIIEEIQEQTSDGTRFWVRWFDSTDLNWAGAGSLVVRSEAR